MRDDGYPPEEVERLLDDMADQKRTDAFERQQEENYKERHERT
jgi:hypothetical protein